MTSSKKGPAEWTDMRDVASVVLKPGVTGDEVKDLYNQWAKNGYDEHLQDRSLYGALQVLKNTVKDLIPGNKDGMEVLDVGAGTGISGQFMKDIGFKVVDGLDPAEAMLKVADEKRIYRNYHCVFLTDQPLDIPAGTYDLITLCGVMGHGCIPCESFLEMTRLVKPGGYIVNCCRAAQPGRT